MSKYTLGLDIGGTKIQAGIVNKKNKVILEKQFPMKGKNKIMAINCILKSINNVIINEIETIGLGITGLVNTNNGVVVQSPNLPKDWHQVNLRQIIKTKYKKPVTIDNDANCIALAESVVGLGKNYNHVLSITIGTGIGAGLVIHKKIYQGSQNSLEFGHTIISNISPPCSCGRIGHLEALVSGRAMTKLYYKILGKKISSYEIIEKARKKNKIAINIIKTMSENLSIGIANAIHTYNPDIVILGGGLSTAKEIIMPAINSYKKKLIFPELAKTKIKISRLNYQAGVIGAALLSRHTKKKR